MAVTQECNIALPKTVLRTLEKKVQQGLYRSVNEVVREAVQGLLEREARMELWLKEEVSKSIKEYDAHPERALTLSQIRSSIKKHRLAKTKKKGNA